jgi:SAM-dependent methyltransferase
MMSASLAAVADRLTCVCCGGGIDVAAEPLRCRSCDTIFEVIGGVPIMLRPEQRGRLQGLERKKRKPAEGVAAALKRALNPPSPSFDIGHGLDRALARYPAGAAILDVGSGTRRLRADVVNVEIDLFDHVDVVADGSRLPFANDTFDLVISQAVLEHVPRPREAVRDMVRVLKPGGDIYVEIPFMQGFHADPHDYQRYTLSGLDVLLEGVRRQESGVAIGPSSALAWMLREYVPLCAPAAIRTPVAVAAAWATTPLKYLDRLVGRRPGAHRIAAGLYFLGTKPAE